MNAQPTAAAAGTIDVGGDLTVNRLGFGAMRITGRGIWGDPPSRDQAIATLRRVVELGVNFIDTADSYGPEVSETLIAEALYPYPDDLVIATKGGLMRPGPNRWEADGRPEHLREVCEGSLRRLRLEQIPLYQFHRPDPAVPLAESIGAIAELKNEGKIRHVGISNVSESQLREAQQIVPIVSVQNRYNASDRRSRVDDRPVRAGTAGVPALGADAGVRQETGGGRGRRAARRDPAPGRAGLAAGHLAADPAHPGHRLARARGGEHRRRIRRAEPGGDRGDRQGRGDQRRRFRARPAEDQRAGSAEASVAETSDYRRPGRADRGRPDRRRDRPAAGREDRGGRGSRVRGAGRRGRGRRDREVGAARLHRRARSRRRGRGGRGLGGPGHQRADRRSPPRSARSTRSTRPTWASATPSPAACSRSTSTRARPTRSAGRPSRSSAGAAPWTRWCSASRPG